MFFSFLFFHFSFILLKNMSGNGQASVWLCAFQGVLATLTCGLCCWLCASYSGTKLVKNQEEQDKDKSNDEVGDSFKDTVKRNSSCVLHPMENQKEAIGKDRSEELTSYSKEKYNGNVKIKTEESEAEEEDINEFEKEVLEHLKIEHCKDIGNNVKVEEKNEIRKEEAESLYSSKEDTDWIQLNNTDNTYVHYLCNKIESEHKQKEKDNTFMKSSTSEVHSDFKTLDTNFNSYDGIHKEKHKSGTNVNSESSFFVNSGSELNGLNKLQCDMDYQYNFLNNDKRFRLNIPQHSNVSLHDAVNSQGCNDSTMKYMLYKKKQKNKPIYQEGEKQDKTIHNLESRDQYDYLQHFDIKRSNEYNHQHKTNRYIDIIPKEINNYLDEQNMTYTKDGDNSLPTCNAPKSFQMNEIEFHKNHKKHLLMNTFEDRNETERKKKKIKTERGYNEINNSLQTPKYINEECMEHKIVDNICISKYTNDAPYNRFVKNSRNRHVSTHDLLLPHVSSNDNINGYKKPLGIYKKNSVMEPMDQSFNGSPVIPLSTYILEKSMDRKLSFPIEQPREPDKFERSKYINDCKEMELQRKMNEIEAKEVNPKNINQAIYEYLRNSMNECSEKSKTQEETQREKTKKQTKIEYISKEWMYKRNNILSDIEVQNSKGGAWSFAQVKLNIDPCETESVLRINNENGRVEKSMNDENNESMNSYNETNEDEYQNETLEFEEMLQNIKSEYVEEENIDKSKNRKNEKIQLKKMQRNVETEKEHKLSSYIKNEEQTNLQIMENLRRSQRIKIEKDKQNQQITRNSKIQIYVKKEKNFIQKKKFQGEYEKEVTRSTISQNKRIQKIKHMNGSASQLSDCYVESESLNSRDLLIKICNQHREVDEYRCASGFANFLIQHMNNKQNESFADLLSFILKLKEEYKMTTPDFIEVFLILETINVDILKKYSNKGWLFVTIHFLKKKSMDKNLKNFMKSLRMDTATISNLTASFYMHKKEIHIEEKEVLRVLSILSDVVIRRSSRIKHSTGTHEAPKGQSKEKLNKEEVLGSCWEPIVIEESISK